MNEKKNEISKEYLRNVVNFFHAKYNVDIQEDDVKKIDEMIIKGQQNQLFKIEMELCRSQKNQCINELHFAMDKYHHKGMTTEEVKTIMQNVLTHKAPTPDITDTVRLLLLEDEIH
jgi:uncharacterized protein YpuA (DUF1002 family)